MDWLRARVLLLITFTCLNAFLGYRLWSRDTQNLRVFSLAGQAQVGIVRAKLDAVGIKVTGEIPTKVPSLSLLRLQRKTPAFASSLLARFGASDLPGPPASRQELHAGPETLILDPNGLATYMPGVQPVPRGLLPATVRYGRREAEEYLKRLGGLPTDAQFVGVVALDEDHVRVDYMQVWRGVPLLPPGLSLVLTRGGVQQVQWQWLQPDDERGDPKAVLPASEALLRLAGHLGDQERRVPAMFNRIDLGYYANPPGGAKSWDTAPVWRITLADGEVFYINAFTGELEH